MVMTSTENNGPGSSKVDPTAEKDSGTIQQIEQLLGDGYKLFLASQYEEASDKLGEATRLSVELYGQFAPQCYQPHYQYGCALVEIARNESLIVKTNAAEEQEESSDDAEEEEGEGAVVEAQQPKGNNPGEGAGETAEQEEEEDVKTEDLALELLEVARLICEKQEESTTWSERKAEVLIALGDCLLIDDQPEEALKQFQAALVIQQSVYPPHHRRIAETHVHLGRTYRSMNMPEEFVQAAGAFENARKVLQLAVEHLEEKAKTDDSPAVQEEIANLKDIIKGVNESVDDARDSAETRQKQLEERKSLLKAFVSQFSEQHAQQQSEQSSTSASAVAAAEVDDLTSQIVRKGAKRAASPKEAASKAPAPAEEDSSNGGGEAKKPKVGED